MRILLGLILTIYILLLKSIGGLKRPKCNKYESFSVEMLLTGTFFSNNWIITHLRPIAESDKCKEIKMVSTRPIPQIKGVKGVYPPRWLVKVLGKTPARLLLFTWRAFVDRPDIIGGFHMIPNGLLIALIGKVVGAKSIYFCGGGKWEVMGGGYLGNRIFARLKGPDRIIEKYLFTVLSYFDAIIVKGSKTANFFGQLTKTPVWIIRGAFDDEKFCIEGAHRDIDLITVGRLTQVKRIDKFLRVVKLLKEQFTDMRAVVVGDGPLMMWMMKLAQELGVDKEVEFTGYQENVEIWLKRSKVFCLTSDSEGLSQAMVQAMLCGAVPVVSNVGDLSDLVVPGSNGFLVEDRSAESFKATITLLLRSHFLWNKLSKNASEDAKVCTIQNVTSEWNKILTSLNN